MDSLCRQCSTPLRQSFCDLGMSPLANSYLTEADLDHGEMFYPLHAYVCMECHLVQLAEFQSPEAIFGDYLYFSSYSQSWLDHARKYVTDTIGRFHLDGDSQVIEIASNDGYLLQYFDQAGVPTLGIEPAKNVAAVARGRGINTKVAFFGTSLAKELTGEETYADLLIGNNVLAHVPDLNDFVQGMSIVLASDGLITLEFPHLLELIELNQFDTIYHEHFSYFSLLTVTRFFEIHGLRVFDVEQLPTHGGSLRIYACHYDYGGHPTTRRVPELIEIERARGLDRLGAHVAYPERVKRAKRALLSFLFDVQDHGLSVVGYGAPAKGNTLLNYCGIGTDLLQYTVDRSPHKQGRFLPGTHLPICAPDHIRETRPDFVLILPWNLRDEIIADISYIREWGGKFVIPIPDLVVVD
ncbi:methyltransferase domain-containing protein [Mycobacterium sp. PS03-16]|uniref:class I SAM-dependent methyltransferase n=1 Tax=Mycobacterium sp. PS03-16 TaxID=2559611 RepID=UPI00107482BA|nr:class I SAM-dependent methyltransferase [Mycobacterium sp. PS03-16]TFV59928.1 methyltransferase domain-containing protein [Mycobacterium sp. PS03-16]